MCGINGIFNLSLQGDYQTEVSRMNSAMNHRGPDSEGTYHEIGLSLAHKRLAIIDLSPTGHQPMFYQNKRYAIIFNGEIYNFQEIKTELKEFSFNSSSDTEVILASYCKWGTSCLEKLSGMFAFALWDTKDKVLFLARDRFGEKPLYYNFSNNILSFSSEIRSLLKSGLVQPKLNMNSLADYLSYQTVHSPNTILNDIYMLPAAHFMLASSKGLEINCYWNPREKINSDISNMPYADICQNINSLLRNSIKQRMISDVPFGAFLSGGIDSSAIVGMMSQETNIPIKTFSVIFNEQEFSEQKYASIIAKKFNTEHHEILLTPKDFLNDIPNALNAMDHPSGDGPNAYTVSKATRNSGVTMALSGLGGDELFAGYPVFKRSYHILRSLRLDLHPQILRKNYALFSRLFLKGIELNKLSNLLSLEELSLKTIYPIFRRLFFDEDLSKLSPNLSYPKFLEKKLAGLKLGRNFLLSEISIAEFSSYMENILLRDSDQMSMAHSLEVRVPFLDHQLVEFVLSVPDIYKHSKYQKKLLIDSLGKLLPEEILQRKKMGFTFPWKSWLKNELNDFCNNYMSIASTKSYYNKTYIISLWDRFLKHDPTVSWAMIWNIVVLEYWLEKNAISY